MNDEPAAPESPQQQTLTPQQAWEKLFEFNPVTNNEKMRLSAIEEIKNQLELLPQWSISSATLKRIKLQLLAKWLNIANARLQLVSKGKFTADALCQVDRLLKDYIIAEPKKETPKIGKSKPMPNKQAEPAVLEEAHEEHATHVAVKLTEGGEINGMELPAGIVVDVPAEDVESIVASGKAKEVNS
jgi:hypothetical protein